MGGPSILAEVRFVTRGIRYFLLFVSKYVYNSYPRAYAATGFHLKPTLCSSRSRDIRRRISSHINISIVITTQNRPKSPGSFGEGELQELGAGLRGENLEERKSH